MEKTCFEFEESITNPNKFIIVPIHENFFLKNTTGSFNIICARLMGLSYGQYLRFCRDCLGAEIFGKNTMYPIALFDKTLTTLRFVKLLNSRANLILWEREHKDWKKHIEELEKYGVKI